MATTSGLVLAAGLGTRFGGRKLLALIDGRPMLQHVLDLAAVAALSPVVVVLGDDAGEIRAACAWREEWIVFNDQPKLGLSNSLRLGLSAVAASNSERAAVLLGDQPFLSQAQLDVVLAAPGSIVVPRYQGKPGNPVTLSRDIWPLAASLEGDRGFSQLFRSRPDLVSYVDVPGTNPGIDTPADLRLGFDSGTG
jgi:molybdenum cofactor cytidylyltransferase